MSGFPGYDQFQAPGSAQDGGSGPGAPTPQEGVMSGQPPEQSPAPFQGGAPGEPNSAPGGQSGDAKTTLW